MNNFKNNCWNIVIAVLSALFGLFGLFCAMAYIQKEPVAQLVQIFATTFWFLHAFIFTCRYILQKQGRLSDKISEKMSYWALCLVDDISYFLLDTWFALWLLVNTAQYSNMFAKVICIAGTILMGLLAAGMLVIIGHRIWTINDSHLSDSTNVKVPTRTAQYVIKDASGNIILHTSCKVVIPSKEVCFEQPTFTERMAIAIAMSSDCVELDEYVILDRACDWFPVAPKACLTDSYMGYWYKNNPYLKEDK